MVLCWFACRPTWVACDLYFLTINMIFACLESSRPSVRHTQLCIRCSRLFPFLFRLFGVVDRPYNCAPTCLVACCVCGCLGVSCVFSGNTVNQAKKGWTQRHQANVLAPNQVWIWLTVQTMGALTLLQRLSTGDLVFVGIYVSTAFALSGCLCAELVPLRPILSTTSNWLVSVGTNASVLCQRHSAQGSLYVVLCILSFLVILALVWCILCMKFMSYALCKYVYSCFVSSMTVLV